MRHQASGDAMRHYRKRFAPSPTSNSSSSRPIRTIRRSTSNARGAFTRYESGRTTGRWQLTLPTGSYGSGSERTLSTIASSSNKRLKLPGGDRFKECGVFAPWQAPTVVEHPCAGGRVARSLSAIR